MTSGFGSRNHMPEPDANIKPNSASSYRNESLAAITSAPFDLFPTAAAQLYAAYNRT
jgi:hypothetical protein